MQASSASIRAQRPRDHPWLRATVWTLDARLRLRHGVIEYARRPDCIFRMGIAAAAGDLILADGTSLRRGDRVIDLHVWNEQFPRMAAMGPTLGWAGQVHRGVDQSLRKLVRHLAGRQDLDDVRAVRVRLNADAAAPSGRLPRLMARYGFEATAAPAPASFAAWLHRLAHNTLIAALVLATNPAAFRTRYLWQGRVEMYLSRRHLDVRYAPCHGRLDPASGGSPR